ncbi:uncharacterized protein [Henckelia pumila]|uniref:uncharacterized protein isoform X2 n=1 Tax=Henckelia pumila TaxID=405737 RepID=UPI003C6E489E
MTANQRKKKVNAASLVGCKSYEQYMVKRKKLKPPQPALNMAPTISLEWDNKKKSVVSKRDQIGISQRHWIPFIEPGPHSHNILADVFSVPQEIFELENLSGVLSYEVWQSLLSENERSLLSQFLPQEAEPDGLVQELLAGDNFHFRNPFLIWGASLCFGELHPDNVLHEEQSLKACKKAYYSHLRKYHNDMIGNLQLWKEKWAGCMDPEVDIVHKVWRTRNYAEKNVPLSEKEYGSDNQNREMVHGDFERRKVCLNKPGDCEFSLQEVAAVSRQGGKLHKHNIQHEDGAKYMSYVKVVWCNFSFLVKNFGSLSWLALHNSIILSCLIFGAFLNIINDYEEVLLEVSQVSKQQHERVKSSMKHAGISIQPRSLNNVLGTIDTLNVQPFEKFEEEEEKKLHDYWLKLVKHDIPDGFVYWRKSRLSRQQLIQLLCEEMGKKVKPEEVTLDRNREGSPNKLMEPSDDSNYEFLPAITIEVVEKDQYDDMLSEQRDNELAIDEVVTVQQAEKIRKMDYVLEEQVQDTVKIKHGDMLDHVCIKNHHQQQVASMDKSSMHSAKLIESCDPVVPQDRHQQQNGSVNGNLQIKSPEMESLVNSASAEIDDTPSFSTYTGNVSRANIPVDQRVPPTSASDVWPTGDARGSYFQSAAYSSSQELKLGRAQLIQEQSLRILDMETDRQDKDAGKDMLPRRSDHTSFFNSYSNQDQSESLSFFKGHNSLSYHHEQKHLGVDFQRANDLMDAGQFDGHLTEQVHPSLHLYPKPKRLNDFYMHQTLQDSMYSDGSRFNMPRQEQVPVNIHDWAAVNSVSMTATSQPHLNSVEVNQNWYSGESGAQDVWAPYESGVHSFSGGRNSDQSLFSVLTECNELRPAANYVPMSSSERFIQAGNFSGMGEGIPPSSLAQEAPNAFNYLSGHEAGTAGVKISSLGWMGIPQQNPGIHESSMGKPFLRSWNQ